VYTPAQRPVAEIRHAAIALMRITPTQNHIGILYRYDHSDGVKFLHLAWHCNLKNESSDTGYLWIDPAHDGRRLRQVAALCRKVWRSNGKAIPYAFSPPNDCIDAKTGEFLHGPARHGLTCASFVLAVFDAAGLPLIQYESWPLDRQGDREWQQLIVHALRTSDPPAPVEHIQAVELDIGVVRFRPEEVAIAATLAPPPAHFEVVVKQVPELLEKLAAVI
jgi:hypothetical protein